MKNKIVILITAALLVGCKVDNTPRQALIDAYKTTEIIPCSELRGNSTDFIVRDTNGAVWFVDVRCPKEKYEIYTATMLFGKINKVDKVKLEE